MSNGEKCPRKYRNLGENSFGEQKYVTADMLRQFCRNDAYLYGRVKELFYMSPPATRKRFNPIPVDASKSWGYEQKGNYITCDDSIEKTVYINFDEKQITIDNNTGLVDKVVPLVDYIDSKKSTAVIESYAMFSDDNSDTVRKICTIPRKEVGTIDKDSVRDYSPWTTYQKDSNGKILYYDDAKFMPKIASDDFTCNEFWYIGFNRTNHYETRPNWLTNQLNGEIPSIARAQTFTIPKGKGGLLKGVTLNLKPTSGNSWMGNTGSPLVVQIRRTTPNYEENIKYPVDSDQSHLAYEEVNFQASTPGVATVTFTNPPLLEEEKTYAIVLLSPLSHISNTYAIGGWSASCGREDTYRGGKAFYSENNGYSWIVYGKGEDQVPYHQGNQAPEDFAFQCHIQQVKKEYDTSKTYELYLKPIWSNKVEKVILNAVDNGASSTANNKYSVKYYASNDGKNWRLFPANNTIDFTKNADGTEAELKHVTFIKAVLKTNTGTDAPNISSMSITLKTKCGTKGYVRTVPYAPKLEGMLSANVWSRINAQYKLLGDTSSCGVEIIQNKEVSETYHIIEPAGLSDYTYLGDLINWKKVLKKSNEDVYNYLKTQPSIIKALAENGIYVTGFTNPTTNKYVPALFTDIQLTGSPASPITDVTLQKTNSKQIRYGEWYDYEIDYQDDKLHFYNDIKIPAGDLKITYNPVFVQNMNGEIGNAENIMPFYIDYHVEQYTIDSELLEAKEINLDMYPLDPVKQVVVVVNSDEDTDDESDKELIEDIDFTVDYDRKKLIFISDDEGGLTSKLNEKDVIEIVYTPDLEDNTMSIAYYFERKKCNSNVEIQPNWIEYKS
ncbi:hypothetical protein [uncultured Methanobrevibacter sp.]|mgnify:CR=1 FL=1|uniref:hypothetical protein n=1 Tax=uncultured Methanobrevibacter sp. TaxID=253161 RepID=UPI0026040205|nr:hypothetical protein [uncultured Methanobrevibacter sp.]